MTDIRVARSTEWNGKSDSWLDWPERDVSVMMETFQKVCGRNGERVPEVFHSHIETRNGQKYFVLENCTIPRSQEAT